VSSREVCPLLDNAVAIANDSSDVHLITAIPYGACRYHKTHTFGLLRTKPRARWSASLLLNTTQLVIPWTEGEHLSESVATVPVHYESGYEPRIYQFHGKLQVTHARELITLCVDLGRGL
jgi:hypothetical protein